MNKLMALIGSAALGLVLSPSNHTDRMVVLKGYAYFYGCR
ncbi:hypothetical protein SAMN05216302_105311 [Nitrosomonas aestuarii]|uniref:Uncharacterized protein n=1 Tax=Nitrosomonas aestuarii TaxID=52441 RepID=A0A1I4GEC5_9PROT|nr:hypothetical protein SAMN05216302_105311 [Nitrosomonas aestuarii]